MFGRAISRGYLCLGGTAAALLVGISPVQAQDVVGPDDLALVRSEIDLLRQEERERARRIAVLEDRLRAMEAAAGLSQAIVLPDAEQALIRARNVGPTSLYMPVDLAATHGAARPVIRIPQDPPPSQEPPVRREPAPNQAVETIVQQEQGLFGQELSFEIGSSYSHFDDARLSLSGFLALDAIFLGRISVEEVTSDIWTLDGSTRYRIGDRAQVDVNVPFLIRRSNFQSGGAGGNAAGLAERAVIDRDIGDVSAGLSYRLYSETEWRPDIVVNARIKAPTGQHPFGVPVIEVPNTQGNLVVPDSLPTGSGVWSGSVGVSMLKTLDPLIVFANASYFYAPETSFDDIDEAIGDQPGEVDLGEAFQYGAGVAFALNDRSSLSFAFTQRLGERATLRRDGGERVPVVGSRSNVAAFNMGASFALTQNASLLTALSVGLTADAPDFTLSVRVPFNF